ncbi:MAG: alpha/beta hydrolase [Anaerolineae bacterium]|nr:alpha/beta hydrolase [Anaerolineae bacterium]
MKNPAYWKSHYVSETDPDEIERNLKRSHFVSEDREFELPLFEFGKNAPNILISPGSGGHSYVFAELAYQIRLRGYNVFIMPKHGGSTLPELMPRHVTALKHISSYFNDSIGVYGEGLGGYVTFYLALAHGPLKSIICQNSPAITTEPEYLDAMLEGNGTAQRRKRMLPLLKFLQPLFPKLPLPISSYLDWEELVDAKPENKKKESLLVKQGYLKDPDFDQWYPLAAIMSLISTPPPNPLSALYIPTMFLVSMRGAVPVSYLNDLYARLPCKKKRVEADGSVYWMLSHPKEAANEICEWFDETVQDSRR